MKGKQAGAALLLGCLLFGVSEGVYISGVSPTYISMGGGPITITGRGFATDNYDPDTPSSYRGGNKVYLQQGSLTLDCPLIHHYSNDEQIVCVAPELEQMRPSWYSSTSMRVYISVNGDTPYGSYYYIRYSWYYTPEIRKTLTRYAPPGAPLMFEGKLFTNRTLATDDDPLFMSASVGDYTCDLNNPLQENSLYGISLYSDIYGTFICRPRGITPGYYDAAFKVTGLGHSMINKYSYESSLMNNKHELYVHQSYPEVQSISPSDGSVVGGQTVTVTGRGFVESLTSVEIGGVPCDVQSVTPIEVVCVTGSQPDEAKFYPGDNGAIVELWRDDLQSNVSIPPHEIRVLDEFVFPSNMTGDDDQLTARARGFLVTRKSAFYSLSASSYYSYGIYMSMDGNPDNLTRLTYSSAKSERMWLEAGVRYYIEVGGIRQGSSGSWYFHVNLYIHDTNLTQADWKWARDERQYLRIQGVTVKDEKQYVNISQTSSMMSLQFGGRSTTEFDTSSLDAEQIAGYIKDLFRTECSGLLDVGGSAFTGSVFYSQDYETTGNSRSIPFCGAKTYHNPYYLYYGLIDVRMYNKICFALRGNHTGRIWISGRRLNDVTFADQYFSASTEATVPLNPSVWVYQCIDFSDLIPSDYINYEPRINSIRLYPSGDGYYVDNVIVSDSETTYTQLNAAVSAGSDVTVDEITVELDSDQGFYINYDIADCQYGVDLIQAGNATVINETTHSTVYSVQGGTIKISRVEEATKPLSGTFDLSYRDRRLKYPLPADATDDAVEDALRDLGFIDTDVYRYGNCYGYQYRIVTENTPGDHDPFTFDTSNLAGPDFYSYVYTSQDGGLRLYPPSRDWFIQPNEAIRVVATVNEVRSKCSTGDCSYQYQMSSTPTISAVSPVNGGNGTEITINGTLFSSIASENNVRVGSSVCYVTSSTEDQIVCTLQPGAGGSHEVKVTVRSLGLASGSVNFTYHVTVLSTTPDQGSISGGTLVKICLDGIIPDFCDSVSVTMGSSVCLIESCDEVNCITCRTLPEKPGAGHSRATEDLVVKVNGGFVNVTGGFTFFTPPPQVTGVDKNRLRTGSQSLVINGSGFGAEQNDSCVYLTAVSGYYAGSQYRCDVVTWSDTLINCTTRKMKPGNYSVDVWFADENGNADSNIDPVSVVLEVRSISPQTGSLVGGTILTIMGDGFEEELLDISLGGESRCDPILVQTDMIVCRVFVSNVRFIDNAGRHPTYGLGYGWDPREATANIGDIIRWKWASPPFVTAGARFAVWQIDAGGDGSYNGDGFISPLPGSYTGQFEYQVTEAKTYTYSGPAVDTANNIVMSGSITVSEADPTVLEISMTLDGEEAVYVPSGAAPAPSTICTSETSAIGNCTDSSPTPTDFQFIASTCFTPTVTSITPHQATVDSVITITGTGFGTSLCQNIVKFGDTHCNVTSQSATHVTCEHNETMDAGVSHKLSLWVDNYGYALNKMDKVLQGFTPLPVINDITPREGSIRGGTRVTIAGSGLIGSADIRTEGSSCTVLSQSFSEIVCSTGDSGVEHDSGFTVAFGVVEVPADFIFHFNETLTPVITSMSPTTIREPSQIVLEGWGLGDSGIEVIVDEDLGYECTVTSINDTRIECDVGYMLTGYYYLKVYSDNRGYASFTVSARIEADNYIASISPTTVGTEGGALLTLYGFGMSDLSTTTVSINYEDVEVLSVNMSQVTILSAAGADNSYYYVRLYSNGRYFYSYQRVWLRSSVTPTINSISPSTGLAGGDTVLIEGTLLSTTSSVLIGGSDCPINDLNATHIECVLPHLTGGAYTPIAITDTGKSTTNETANFVLTITSVSTPSGAGGVTLTIAGAGFDIESAEITVCNGTCAVITRTSSEILCDAPNVLSDIVPTRSCDVVLTQAAGTARLDNAVEYNITVTPNITDVSPRRGGTGGGTRITISGQGFMFEGATPMVTIDGSSCIIPDDYTVTDTEIQCETEPHVGSLRTYVRVAVGDNGVAIRDNADYFYADVWSSKFTWGGNLWNIPREGDAVVVQEGQTLVIDVVTPVLKLIVIKGGTVLFDSDQAYVNLQSEYIVVSHGGTLQIGTEDEPYLSQAQITLHGHVRSIELPIYGAKVLAVTNGTIDMHGKPIETTWTLISEMANEGDTSISLQQPVRDWKVGDNIVIASTGGESEQYQNEQHEIAGISDDFLRLNLTRPLKYLHLYVNEMVEGVHIHAAAEVGLLSRNVRFAGNINDQWTEFIEGCDQPFRAGQFAIQNCYEGKFGDEIASDQFGGHIMMHPKKNHPEMVTGRFSFIEVTHAGQAFRIGRYPIHYHVTGDQTGKSYVRGCGIHRTFNRAITIHGTHGLLVEHNVVYDTMGHAIFTEDGVETNNIIQYNLAVFTKSHSSLLNVDQTPASFWLVNPDNIVRHNHAAGGSHFGFWYRLESRPTGLHTGQYGVCPSGIRVQEFYNNTAHSFGRYGLWVFDHSSGYFPKDGPGGCSGSDALSTFEKFFSWNCAIGAETVDTGSVRFKDFLISDARDSGIKMFSSSGDWGDNGPGITNATIVGHTSISDYSPTGGCTSVGISLPNKMRASVNGAHMINFDREDCVAFAPTPGKANQGGFPMQFENIQYDNSPHKTEFHWQHQTWWYDLDGTFSGVGANYTVTPWNELLSHDDCMNSTEIEAGWSVGVPAAICNDNVDFVRWAFNNPQPPSLEANDLFIWNEWGNTTIPYQIKRLTHNEGWMATLPVKSTFTYEFAYGSHFVNISYSGVFYFLESDDYIIMNKAFISTVDRFFINGAWINGSADPLDPEVDVNGDWHWDDNSNELSYLVSGTSSRERRAPPATYVDRAIQPLYYQCFIARCNAPEPPPPPPPQGKRPLGAVFWSSIAAWDRTPAGWGGNYGDGNFGPPRAGDDVIILPGLWVVIDEASLPLPHFGNLTIYGTLEVDRDVMLDVTLDTELIWVAGEGRLVAGFNDPGEHYPGNLTFHMRGNHTYPPREFGIPGGPAIGRKAIGVFGELDLHGTPRQTYWTRLNSTVEVGSTVLTLQDPTDWKAGEQIVLATTDFESFHTEVLDIDSVNEAGDEITLVSGVQHRHIGGNITRGNYTFSMSAEVGLLTRNIRIVGENYTDLAEEAFGARVLVGRYRAGDVDYVGSASLDNVEFYHTGQEGYTALYDPRYSLAFLNLDTSVLPDFPNRVVGCSFHDGFSPGIGVYGSHQVNIERNVIHHTIGQGIVVEGRLNNVVGNLVTLMVFPGTYLDREEGQSLDWEAAIEIHYSIGTKLTDNAVAGSEKIGFHLDGDSCTGTAQITGNTVHSVLHGVHMFKNDGQPRCTRIANFVIWKAYDFGIYFNPRMTVEIENVILADNMNGIMPLISSPNILKHQMHNKYVSIENSLIIGESEFWECSDYTITPDIAQITKLHRSPRSPDGGKVGITMTTFLSEPVGAPEKAWHKPMSYPNMDGRTVVSNVLFTNFEDSCGVSNVVFQPNTKSGDAMHPVYLDNLEYIDSPKANRIQYLRPNILQINPSDCVDMDCDGMKKLLIRDKDGTTTGDSTPGSIISDSAFEWNGDPRRGLGDYRIPKTLLSTINGDRIPVDDIAPYKGIIGTSTGNCTWNSDWLAFECKEYDYEMMIIESMDSDTETRRLSPVAILGENTIDLINGPMDHGWCGPYTCQKRVSTFYSIVAMNKHYEIHLTSTSPKVMRYHIVNIGEDQSVTLALYYSTPLRLDVYRSGVVIYPNNADIVDGKYILKPKDPNLPDDQYWPKLSDTVSGSNYMEKWAQTLYILVRGPDPIEIRISDVVIVSFNFDPVPVSEFYSENIIRNLVLLLGITEDQIRIVNVVRETPDRRKRSTETVSSLAVEIGDPPASNETSNLTSSGASLSVEDLTAMSANLTEMAQDGSLTDVINVTVVGVEVFEPVVTPVYIEPQNSSLLNDTVLVENSTSSQVIVYLIPHHIVSETKPVYEMLQPHSVSVELRDFGGYTVENVARDWWCDMLLVDSDGITVNISGNLTARFEDGYAVFSDIIFLEEGEDYSIKFLVQGVSWTPLQSSSFNVSAGPIAANVSAGPVTDGPVTDGPVTDGPVTDGPVTAQPTAKPESQQKTIIIGTSVAGSLLVIALIVVVVVLCLKKKNQGKVGVSEPSPQERTSDMETHSTEGDRSEREDNSQNRVRPSTPAYKSRRHVRASNNVRPYNIQEEVMEDIGTGVKSKLVIRDLDTAEAAVGTSPRSSKSGGKLPPLRNVPAPYIIPVVPLLGDTSTESTTELNSAMFSKSGDLKLPPLRNVPSSYIIPVAPAVAPAVADNGSAVTRSSESDDLQLPPLRNVPSPNIKPGKSASPAAPKSPSGKKPPTSLLPRSGKVSPA